MLWKLKVYYCIKKSPTLAHMLNQIYPAHTLASNFLKIFLNIILPSTLVLSSVFIPSDFPAKTLHAFLFFPTHQHATCSVHLVLLYVVTLIMSGEDYMLWSSSQRSLPQSSVTSFVIDPHIFLDTIYPKTHGPAFMWETQVLHPYNIKGKIVSVAALISKVSESWRSAKFL